MKRTRAVYSCLSRIFSHFSVRRFILRFTEDAVRSSTLDTCREAEVGLVVCFVASNNSIVVEIDPCLQMAAEPKCLAKSCDQTQESSSRTLRSDFHGTVRSVVFLITIALSP